MEMSSPVDSKIWLINHLDHCACYFFFFFFKLVDLHHPVPMSPLPCIPCKLIRDLICAACQQLRNLMGYCHGLVWPLPVSFSLTLSALLYFLPLSHLLCHLLALQSNLSPYCMWEQDFALQYIASSFILCFSFGSIDFMNVITLRTVKNNTSTHLILKKSALEWVLFHLHVCFFNTCLIKWGYFASSPSSCKGFVYDQDLNFRVVIRALISLAVTCYHWISSESSWTWGQPWAFAECEEMAGTLSATSMYI